MQIKRYIEIFAAYFKKGASEFAQYPGDQAISAISLVIENTTSFVVLLVIVGAAGDIGGWNIYYISILYSFFMIIRSLNAAFLDGIWNIGNVYVRGGRFDVLLTRPLSPFLQLWGYRLDYSALGLFFTGLGLNLWLLYKIDFMFTGLLLLLYVVFILAGTAITAAVYLIFNSLNFWLVRGNEIADLSQTVQEFAKYPQHIFPRAFQFIMAFIIPYAFATYYPVSILTGRMPLRTIGVLVLVSFTICFAASIVWRCGVRSYNSTGS